VTVDVAVPVWNGGAGGGWDWNMLLLFGLLLLLPDCDAGYQLNGTLRWVVIGIWCK
jgi:hypothetical protein